MSEASEKEADIIVISESKPSFSLHLKKSIKTDSKLKEDEIIKSDFAMLFGDD